MSETPSKIAILEDHPMMRDVRVLKDFENFSRVTIGIRKM